MYIHTSRPSETISFFCSGGVSYCQRMRLGFLKYIQPTAESEAPAALRRDSWRNRAWKPPALSYWV